MKKVLIIDDDEILRDLLEKKLTRNGYEVQTAEDGEKGLKEIRKNRPDLVLLDIIMPNMGGFDVLKEMNKDEDLEDISVVIVSNSGQPVEIDKAKEMGVKDWVVKTEFDPEEVLKKVVDQIGKAENKN